MWQYINKLILGQLKILLSHSVLLFSMLKRWFQRTSGAAEIFKSNFPSSIGMHLQQKLFRKIFLFACQIRLSVVDDQTLVLSFLKNVRNITSILINSQFGFTSYARNSQKKQYLIFGKMRNIFQFCLSVNRLVTIQANSN